MKYLYLSFIILTVFTAYLLCDEYNIHIKLQPGQVWTKTLNEGNPFDDEQIIERKIIALSDSYVQYIQEGDTLSLNNLSFKHYAKLK